MFIDTSAFIAMLTNEPDCGRLVAAIEAATHRCTSGLVRLESVMRCATILRTSVEDAHAAFDKLIEECGVTVVPITDGIARSAVEAFARFGKGRGTRAQLNLADCMSYAVAREYRFPILFIGEDFTHTDLKSALADPRPTRS